MSFVVVEGAKLVCSMGTETTRLKLTTRKYTVDKRGIATIKDSKASRDIVSFGMCQAMSNPSVASATAAAGGVLTPVPCLPPELTDWTPGAKHTYQESPDGSRVRVLTDDSRCVCVYAGVVTIVAPNTHTKVK